MELDTIIDAFSGLSEQFEKRYYGLKGMAYLYIERQEKNLNKLEHLLDDIMDSYEFIEDAKETFFKLCEYVETLDKETSDDYKEIWREMFEPTEEELNALDESIKKLEKKYTN